ncbi:sugar phosphate isomerase/epimerase family protein [Chloroflexota bacterium]
MLPLGMSAWFGFSLPLEERLKLIKQAGFDTTCLWFGVEEDTVRDGESDRMPALVRNTGLLLDNIHATFLNHHLIWSAPLDDEVLRIREELKATLAFCTRHDVPLMVAHLTTKYCTSPPNEKGLEIVYDLVTQAEKLGVTIALENTRRPEYLEYIFSNIQSLNLRFCYDSSHDFLPDHSRGELLSRWGHLLVTTHISDNKGLDDDHLLPGRGTIDWQAIEKNFPKNIYRGAILLETDGPEAGKGLTPEEFLQTGYEWLHNWAEKLE